MITIGVMDIVMVIILLTYSNYLAPTYGYSSIKSYRCSDSDGEQIVIVVVGRVMMAVLVCRMHPG